jgi:hypothetical protein
MPSKAQLPENAFHFDVDGIIGDESAGLDCPSIGNVDARLRDVFLPDGFLARMRRIVADSVLDEAVSGVERPNNIVNPLCRGTAQDSSGDACGPTSLLS